MQKDIFHKLIIIGCGASGMTAALSASLYEKDILIIERNDRCGRKLLATGNGKCNFTNLNISPDDFRSEDSNTAFSVYQRFDCNSAIDFFLSIGIPVFNRNSSGYCYPHSEQASTVRNAFDNRLYANGISVAYDTKVNTILYNNDKYTLDCTLNSSEKVVYSCNRLLIASGGSAQSCYGTDGGLLSTLKHLGHSVITPMPALTGLTTDSKYTEGLNGVRQHARISLEASDNDSNPEMIYSEYGEIIFSKSGISGIPVMNASRFALKKLNEGMTVHLKLDFFPEWDQVQLSEYLGKLISCSHLKPYKLLTGLVNDKLMQTIWNIVNSDDISALNDSLSYQLKNFDLNIIGSSGFDNAQCSSGGIPLSEIDTESLESKLCHGLYFAGEVLDVDGKCGGYNLQWAWSTGAIAGAYAGGGCFDKDKFIKASLQAD